MSGVKRWIFFCYSPRTIDDFTSYIAANPDHELYVLASDHDAEIERLTMEREALSAALDRLRCFLKDIHGIAHDASTGPVVKDRYWEIRSFANEALSAEQPKSHSYWERRLRETERALDAAKAERDALYEKLVEEREMHRRAQHPEPFHIGAVYTERGGIRYMLPIVHQWNEYPDIALEVGWCEAPAAIAADVSGGRSDG